RQGIDQVGVGEETTCLGLLLSQGGKAASGLPVVTRREVTCGAVVFDARPPLGAKDAVLAAAAVTPLMGFEIPAHGFAKPVGWGSRGAIHGFSPPVVPGASLGWGAITLAYFSREYPLPVYLFPHSAG